MLDLGELLKKTRLGRDFTVRELGRLTGVSYSLISKFETGERKPDLRTLEKLREKLMLEDDKFRMLLRLGGYKKIFRAASEKGGGKVTWKIIEVLREFKSIYPTM